MVGASAPKGLGVVPNAPNAEGVVPNGEGVVPNGEGVPKAPNAIGAGPGAGAPKRLKPIVVMNGMVVVAAGMGTPGINVGAKGPMGLTSPGKRSGNG